MSQPLDLRFPLARENGAKSYGMVYYSYGCTEKSVLVATMDDGIRAFPIPSSSGLLVITQLALVPEGPDVPSVLVDGNTVADLNRALAEGGMAEFDVSESPVALAFKVRSPGEIRRELFTRAVSACQG